MPLNPLRRWIGPQFGRRAQVAEIGFCEAGELRPGRDRHPAFLNGEADLASQGLKAAVHVHDAQARGVSQVRLRQGHRELDGLGPWNPIQPHRKLTDQMRDTLYGRAPPQVHHPFRRDQMFGSVEALEGQGERRLLSEQIPKRSKGHAADTAGGQGRSLAGADAQGERLQVGDFSVSTRATA